MLLHSKVALITGAATGIGRASALLFAREGARIAIADINRPDAERTVADIEKEGGQACFVECDLRQTGRIADAVDETVRRYGRLDVFFHNAGVAGPGLLEHTTEAQYDQVMDIHLKAGFFGAKYALPHLRRAGGGSILFTASGLGLRPSRQSPAYSASKAGLLMLARALAVAHAEDGIRVNAICPGPIDSTPLWQGVLARNPDIVADSYAEMNRQVRPIKRLGNPEEMARAALFLVAPENSYITGVALPVDGGGAMS
ncbi:SDR family NAD(P)-dependent oxidoreductase [Pigmentiphaga sp. NML030171]|uniref:SDR family NAD(P)-dependent oxidoreductase n=1 Tax=Pigmentiphaga sp. NML030171 TaxID=2008676 RepID=UPI0015962A9E|nr:SDR family oxidoreductase [Pigmentiphaga sp. NML030171]